MQHLSYRISEISSVINGQIFPENYSDTLIKDILIDSRKLITPDKCLFFALVTDRGNGHEFILELYEQGIRYFVISQWNPSFADLIDGCFIQVEDSLTALQTFTKFHRKRFEIPVIGITGSNGKTIIKEWLFQLLAKDKKVVRSPKSYNSQVGVPLSVWQMDTSHDIALFEAGISEPEEMDKLQAIIKPTLGIFTNIGEAHSENFISISQKVGEKLKLFTKVEKLIYCTDHSDVGAVVIRSGMLENIDVFTWSRRQDADLKIINSEKISGGQTIIRGIYNGNEASITIPFIDSASIENAIHCWATMIVLGYDQEVIPERFNNLLPIAMRLELKSGINHCTLINDSYNSDIKSLTIALDFLLQQSNNKRKTLILSDILQSGKSEEELYSYISEIVNSKGVDRIVGIGPAINRQRNKFKIESSFFLSTDEFLTHFAYTAFSNEMILLKGARVFEFERISRALEEKSHETVLEINLNSLVHNLNYFRGRIPQETKIMAMVKAFSYGSGTYEIANTLQFHRVDYLAVAYADEGVELRQAGIHIPIMVMNPDEQSFDSIIKYNLEPVIYSFRILDLMEEAIEKNILPDNKPVKIHIKLDTGMHRLGFGKDEIDSLMERIINNKLVYTQSVFSHLAASEDAAHDTFTRKQIALFDKLSTQIISKLDHPVLKHILNSAGIARFPDSEFDMVRLGISLYGVATTPEYEEKLQNVSTLKSIVSQLKHIPEGETVGYQREFKAEQDVMIGIIPVGYADGLRRILGNGRGKVWINSKPIPIIGNVCMDMCMVDITGQGIAEGDEVVIFGEEYPLENMAAASETIPYEILTSIPPRVKRIYYQE